MKLLNIAEFKEIKFTYTETETEKYNITTDLTNLNYVLELDLNKCEFISYRNSSTNKIEKLSESQQTYIYIFLDHVKETYEAIIGNAEEYSDFYTELYYELYYKFMQIYEYTLTLNEYLENPLHVEDDNLITYYMELCRSYDIKYIDNFEMLLDKSHDEIYSNPELLKIAKKVHKELCEFYENYFIEIEKEFYKIPDILNYFDNLNEPYGVDDFITYCNDNTPYTNIHYYPDNYHF